MAPFLVKMVLLALYIWYVCDSIIMMKKLTLLRNETSPTSWLSTFLILFILVCCQSTFIYPIIYIRPYGLSTIYVNVYQWVLALIVKHDGISLGIVTTYIFNSVPLYWSSMQTHGYIKSYSTSYAQHEWVITHLGDRILVSQTVGFEGACIMWILVV